MSEITIRNMENMTKVPVHVSMIMDGNGRWAKERGKERVHGHFEGVESVRACVEAALETGVKYLSVFAFSEENWNRPEEEVLALMGLMVKAMAAEMKSLDRNGVRFIVLGNRSRLSGELNAEIDSCMEMTADNEALTLIVFLSYSGKWDILQAANKFYANAKERIAAGEQVQMSADDLAANLSTSDIPDPDLLIRSSGEQRISNYMLWQTAYTEFYFTDVLWPDFRKKEFQLALDAYAKRERRFGKV